MTVHAASARPAWPANWCSGAALRRAAGNQWAISFGNDKIPIGTRRVQIGSPDHAHGVFAGASEGTAILGLNGCANHLVTLWCNERGWHAERAADCPGALVVEDSAGARTTLVAGGCFLGAPSAKGVIDIEISHRSAKLYGGIEDVLSDDALAKHQASVALPDAIPMATLSRNDLSADAPAAVHAMAAWLAATTDPLDVHNALMLMHLRDALTSVMFDPRDGRLLGNSLFFTTGNADLWRGVASARILYPALEVWRSRESGRYETLQIEEHACYVGPKVTDGAREHIDRLKSLPVLPMPYALMWADHFGDAPQGAR